MADQGKGSPDWRSQHLWQFQPVRDGLLIAAIIGLLYLGKLLSAVTVPIMLALTLAYLFEPVVARVTKSGKIGRPFASGSIIVLAIALVIVPAAIGGTFAVVQGIGFAQRVAENAQSIGQLCDAYSSFPDRETIPFNDWVPNNASDESKAVYDQLDGPNWQRLTAFVAKYYSPDNFDWVRAQLEKNVQTITETTIGTGGNALRMLIRTATSTFTLGLGAFLTAFFFFFMSTNYARVLAYLTKLVPERNRDLSLDLIGKMDRVVAGFIRGRLTIAMIQSVIFALAYFAAGVPAALMLGVLVGFLSIVPYLALVGVPVSIVMIWLDPPGGFRGEWYWILFAPIIIYGAIQALDDYVWTPRIQGKQTGMDTPTVLFASIAGGILAGMFGLLLAIPVAACIKILLQEIFWPRFHAWTEGDADDPLPFGKKKRGEAES